MIELTESQILILDETKSEPVQLLDPQTGQTYVLIRQSSFDKLKSLLDLSEYDPNEGAAYMNEIMAEDDANDPLLEGYQEHARQP